MGKQRKGETRIEGRREFLKNMLVSGAGAAIVAAGGPAAAAPAATAAAAAPPPAGPAGYRETDHVRAYYETAGL